MAQRRIGSDKIDRLSFMDLFGQMRWGELMLTEKQGNESLNYRLTRFRLYEKKDLPGQSRKLLPRCIDLSIRAHEFVKNTDTRLRAIHSAFPSNSNATFERVIRVMTKKRLGRVPKAPKRAVDEAHRWWNESVGFFRAARQASKRDRNKRLNDAIAEYFSDRDPIEVEAHRTHIALILTTLKNADSAAFVALSDRQMWSVQGGAIERKILGKCVGEFSWSATGGQLPVVDAARAFRNLLEAWLETDEAADTFFEGQGFADRYFEGYLQLLMAWAVYSETMAKEAIESAAFVRDDILDLGSP